LNKASQQLRHQFPWIVQKLSWYWGGSQKIPSDTRLQKTNGCISRKYKIEPEKSQDRLDVLYKKF